MSKFKIYLICVLSLVLVSGCTTTETVSDPSLTNIIERGVIVAGTSPPYGPMEYYDGEDIVGIDIDIAKEIALAIGVELEVKDVDFDFLLDSVDSGEVDIAVAAITITPDRSETHLFSIPYFNGGQSVVVRSASQIELINELEGKNVGVEDDQTPLKDAIFEHVENPLVHLHKDSDGPDYSTTVVAKLKNETLDAFVIDYVAAVTITQENPELKILGEPFTQEYYGIATKLGNDALMDEINEILRELKRTGRLDEIKDKWVKL